MSTHREWDLSPYLHFGHSRSEKLRGQECPPGMWVQFFR
jgi:hypothetical protein